MLVVRKYECLAEDYNQLAWVSSVNGVRFAKSMFYSALPKSRLSQALPVGRSKAISIVTCSEIFCPISIGHSSCLHLPGSFCRGPPSFGAALSPWHFLHISSMLFGRIFSSKHLAYLLRLFLKIMESEV